MEILIPILMFAVPVIMAIISAKKKNAKTKKPEVIFEELFPEASDDEPGVRLPAKSGDNTQRATVKAAKPAKTHAVPAVKSRQIVDAEEKSIEIDKKKLIIYSEILKPKFDE